jgi:hypothetical protein
LTGNFFITAGEIRTKACARAVRAVAGFAETSTMRGAPAES